jgi:hypothetical protein
MRKITIKCDKCKQEIEESKCRQLELPLYNQTWDLCPSCYTDLVKTIGSWLEKKKEK